MYTNKKGFTLTELIAVVVVLGVLASVAVGSYRKSVERSRMTEAYTVGSALLEGVNRYYYDNRSRADRKCPKVADLDLTIAKADACSGNEYCVQTQFFQITIPSSCSDTAPKVTATNSSSKYAIEFYPDFATNRSQDKCVILDNSAKGKGFCLSAGYKTCSGTAFCCKGTIATGNLCQ